MYRYITKVLQEEIFKNLHISKFIWLKKSHFSKSGEVLFHKKFSWRFSFISNYRKWQEFESYVCKAINYLIQWASLIIPPENVTIRLLRQARCAFKITHIKDSYRLDFEQQNMLLLFLHCEATSHIIGQNCTYIDTLQTLRTTV